MGGRFTIFGCGMDELLARKEANERERERLLIEYGSIVAEIEREQARRVLGRMKPGLRAAMLEGREWKALRRRKLASHNGHRWDEPWRLTRLGFMVRDLLAEEEE